MTVVSGTSILRIKVAAPKILATAACAIVDAQRADLPDLRDGVVLLPTLHDL